MSNQTSNSFQVQLKVFTEKLKGLAVYALNPAKFLSEDKKTEWYLHLILPACGWMFFFMQVALDKNNMYYVPAGGIALYTFLGLVLGYAAVGGIGWLTASILGMYKMKVSWDKVISLIAMSHTYMVISLLIGFIYRIFGSGTSAVFGIAGLLCTLMPIYTGLRALGKQNAFFAPIMATVVGVLLLMVWSLIIMIPI